MDNINDSNHDKHIIISWPGEQIKETLTEPVLRLGRSRQGNDIVIEYPVVSRHHATLKWQDEHYLIIDGQTQDGEHKRSTNGLFFEGRRVTQMVLKNGDIIRIPDQSGNFITLMYFDDTSPPPYETEYVLLDKEITIGRANNNDLVLDDPRVSNPHAVVAPTRKGHAIRDLRSSSGTFVNGRTISQIDLKIGDIVQIGSNQLRYEGKRLIRVDLRQQGIRLDGINICKQIPINNWFFDIKSSPKLLLDNISLSIQPREFVAIVGESGSGKSTLLKALNGSQPAEKGQVLINGKNLYDQFDAYRQGIGYVPQDDIIHNDLSISEVLNYTARLRLPTDTSSRDIRCRIDKVLDQVSLLDKRKLVKNLSGGQRKRVSIAVELIADPGIIFLDEPTSGLDPGLDRKMMFTLRNLAHTIGKTVILVTHATSNITECDKVLFLARGGRMVFYGTPQEALEFFEVKDNFAAIYDKVGQEEQNWAKKFRESSYYQLYVDSQLNPDRSNLTCPYCQKLRKRPNAKLCHSCGRLLPNPDTPASESYQRATLGIKTKFQQFKILTARYLKIISKDQQNMLILLSQVFGIVLFLFMVIHEQNMFRECLDSIKELSNKGYFNPKCDIPFSTVSGVQKIIFLLACIGTWFGIINAVREIVKESPIYRRERLVNLNIVAYVGSKVGVMFGLSIIQTFLLVVIIHSYAPFPQTGALGIPAAIEIFLTISLITFTSSCWGLFLSAIMERENRVMSVIPLFLIPQIIFAGIIFPFDQADRKPNSNLPEVLRICETMDISCGFSTLTFSRWGVEALGASVNLGQMWEGFGANHVQIDTSPPFPFKAETTYLLRNWVILIVYALLATGLTIGSLYWKDLKRK